MTLKPGHEYLTRNGQFTCTVGVLNQDTFRHPILTVKDTQTGKNQDPCGMTVMPNGRFSTYSVLSTDLTSIVTAVPVEASEPSLDEDTIQKKFLEIMSSNGLNNQETK